MEGSTHRDERIGITLLFPWMEFSKGELVCAWVEASWVKVTWNHSGADLSFRQREFLL